MMADKYALKLAALLGGSPQQGGLSYGDYPNPYQNPNANGGGLRAYKEGTGYGGQMMPKGQGWLGELPNTGTPGSVSTELSVGDSRGDFPSITPNTSADQLKRLLALKPNQRMPNDIYNTALDFANQRRASGLNPFKDSM